MSDADTGRNPTHKYRLRKYAGLTSHKYNLKTTVHPHSDKEATQSANACKIQAALPAKLL